MRLRLDFGLESASLNVPADRVVGRFRGPAGLVEGGVDAAVRRSLRDPLEAPPIRRALTPDDRITLAVDAGLPESAAIVAPLVDVLLEADIAPSAVTILSHPEADADSVARLEAGVSNRFQGITVLRHDPADAGSIGYLASTKDGRRIYLHRAILDADAVIAVGRIGYDAEVGMRGTAAELFPTFSNAETQHFSRLTAIDGRSAPEQLRSRQLCDEVAWLVGLFYAVGVALGHDNEVNAIWAGHFESVQRAADEYTHRHWTIDPPDVPPDLVVASVSRSMQRSDWRVVAAALDTAHELAAPDGRILLLSDLEAPPGPTGQWLLDNENPWGVLARLRRSQATDTLSTAQCAATLATHKVHLASRLPAETVDALSMVAVESAREMENLVRRSNSCFFIEDADRARVGTRQRVR